MKKLGIIIPCYNCEKTINDCVDSIIKQSKFKECELILVNDGSTDNTEKYIEKYKKYDNIVIYTQENKGVSEARNKGMEICTSKYIMFVDSDDKLYLDALEFIFSNLNDNNSDTLIIFGINQEFYKNDKLIREINISTNEDMSIDLPEQSIELIPYIENNLINAPYSKIFERKVIEEYKITFDENLKIQEDLCFNLEYISKIKKIKIYKGKIYRYLIIGNTSTTNKFLPERMENYKYVENKIYEFYENKGCSKEILSEIYYISVKNTWSAIINLFCPGNNLSFKGRREYLNKIMQKCDFEVVNKAYRKGLKYNILKRILMTKNISLIYICGNLISNLKRKMYMNYK